MNDSRILVQKFGGTSVSTAERREHVLRHVRSAREAGHQVAIVVSAMGRRGDPYATDTLLDLLRGEGERIEGRDYDAMFVCGEIISVTLMAHVLKRQGIPATGLSGAQAGIYTDDNHTEAEIVEIDPARVLDLMGRGVVPVIAGGQGVFRGTGAFTTLGRGGSDTSGVAVGAALGAAKVEIFTDVDGVARADPRIVPRARFLEKISYGTMLDLARYGAGVIHPRAVRAAQPGSLPVALRSTFSTTPGTLIADVRDEMPIVGLAVLGPLQSMVLRRDPVGPEERANWERRRQILSLVDDRTGCLVLAVSAERSHGLEWIRQAVDAAADPAAGRQAWITLVGESGALLHRHQAVLDLLRGENIEVLFHELAGTRAHYVIAAGAEARAAKLLYSRILEG